MNTKFDKAVSEYTPKQVNILQTAVNIVMHLKEFLPFKCAKVNSHSVEPAIRILSAGLFSIQDSITSSYPARLGNCSDPHGKQHDALIVRQLRIIAMRAIEEILIYASFNVHRGLGTCRKYRTLVFKILNELFVSF